MELKGEKEKYKAPEELIQFIVDTKDGRFNSSIVTLQKHSVRLPNYHQPSDPVYLHGIR